MEINILKSEKDYEIALNRLEKVFHAEPNTPDGDEAELLAMVIENYEDKQYPIESPTPIEAIKYKMDQLNMTKSDLTEIVGYNSRVSELFNNKRKLTLKMIRNLHDKLNIPYDILMSNY